MYEIIHINIENMSFRHTGSVRMPIQGEVSKYKTKVSEYIIYNIQLICRILLSQIDFAEQMFDFFVFANFQLSWKNWGFLDNDDKSAKVD